MSPGYKSLLLSFHFEGLKKAAEIIITRYCCLAVIRAGDLTGAILSRGAMILYLLLQAYGTH
jgi:hypothetical protein